MKLLVFSDTHLTTSFDLAKFNALKEHISLADQVIINGDYWDGYVVDFERFVSSPWQQLFPILKEKQAIYIHGNHDRPEFADERVNLFSVDQKFEHRLKIGEIEYVFTHGHLLSAALDGGLHLSDKQVRSWLYRWSSMAFSWLEGLTIKLFGRAVLHFGGYHHRKMKRWVHSNLSEQQYLVCGHSHTAEIYHQHRLLNPGTFNHGLVSCLWIDESGVTPVQSRYK